MLLFPEEDRLVPELYQQLIDGEIYQTVLLRGEEQDDLVVAQMKTVGISHCGGRDGVYFSRCLDIHELRCNSPIVQAA